MFISSKYIIIAVLVLAFMLRIMGITYGLPLWLHDDEAAFPLAALKMIQLKTVFPAAHFDEFKSVLYYPPYISYFYLPFFAIFLGIKYLLYSGTQFTDYLGADLSGFFIIARLINILLATVSVYLVYRIFKNLILRSPTSEEQIILGSRTSGILAAFLLATSLIHTVLSMTGRHWLPVSFIILLGFYFLTRPDWSFRKRYIVTGILAGLGMGVSSLAGFLTILMILCALFYDRKSIRALARKKFLYVVVFGFILLALIPSWLYPGSYGYSVDITAKESKSIAGLLASPIMFLKPVLLSEPILLFLAVLGLAALARKNWRLALIFIIFWIIYSGAFYWIFRYEHRFALPLVPFMAILGGYGIGMIFQYFEVSKLKYAVILIILLLPLAASLKLSYLAYKGDSRAAAREWSEENLPAGEKVIVNARLMRLSVTPEAVEEQKNIQGSSLRRADISEAALGGSPFYKSFHALNLFTVTDERFYSDFESYIKENKYNYLILSLEDFQKNEGFSARFQKLAESGEELARFGESDKIYSLSGGYFGNVWEFFKLKQFGPPIGIYKLR
jgi:hypothetical protein